MSAALPAAAWRILLAATVALGLGQVLLALQTTAIGSLLFMNHGVAHETTVLVERGSALVLLLATAAVLVPRLRASGAAGLLVFAAVLAWASVDQAGYPYSRYAIGAQAMRIGTPLALLLCVWPRGRPAAERARLVEGILLTVTALTFVVHGLEALWRHPWFLDLTIGTAQRLGAGRISESQAGTLLLVVGCIDLASVAGLLLFRSRAIAGWMACWGFFTAALRLLNYGAGAWSETIVRLPQGLLPVVLALCWNGRRVSVPGPAVEPVRALPPTSR